MKRLLIALVALCLITTAYGQGIPFIRNFMAEDYHANNTNYDIEIDELGNVFVANFEGLLYYDYAEWRILHTPGITRLTVVYRASDNTIWVGGYNYFGKVVRKANGEIDLQRVGPANLFRGEVYEIYEVDGELHFIADNDIVYQVKGDKVTAIKEITNGSPTKGKSHAANIKEVEWVEKKAVTNDTVWVVPLENGLRAIVKKNAGLVIADDKNHSLLTITDANGLCSNDIAYMVYDGHGHLWGATSKGVFVIQIPTAITRFTSHEGLAVTILSIEDLNGRIYAGSDDGLFRQEGHRFMIVPQMPHACWELKKSGNGLLAATADGVFRLYADGRIKQLTTKNTLALLDEGSHIYCGETDGIYLIDTEGRGRKKVCDLKNVKKFLKDDKGTIWAQSLYGTVWYKKKDDSQFQLYKEKEKTETMRTIVLTDGKVSVVNAEATTPIPYPLVSYVDNSGVTWLTDIEGKDLYRWKNGKRLNDLDKFLNLIGDKTIRSVFTRQNEIWLGNDAGLFVINTQVQDPSLSMKPNLLIRSVKLGNDSILWGGFGEMPKVFPKFSQKGNDLQFTFSTNYPILSSEIMYRYRLNDGKWSSWSPNTSASFAKLSHGNYTFYVQASDLQNNVSDIASVKFYINPPFYYRWYMNLLYLVLLGVLLYVLFQLRLRKLRNDKIRLENIVQERSAEVVRLEKMATAGKLTQGLIDRILNPLNYINNFSKLSEGLVKDVKANVEDEKEHMDQENYDDTIEVLDMLTGNLQKVGEHGQNTTRTLKAMEEMLKDRSGGIKPMDLRAVLHQDKEMLHEYYKQEIEQYGIKTVFDDSESPLPINGNIEQLSKTIMSLLANAVYAVVKKAQKFRDEMNSEGTKAAYTPEIALHVTRQRNNIQISIRDNGIGIESAIIDKIFDPFFTTKPTGEAAGTGLYLSREIVQNHGGDIQVKSAKDEYSEFIITLPTK